MKRLETIADSNAELFIRKHFSNLSNKDRMVSAMRRIVKDTIRHALLAYELERAKSN